ncbi:hypothetical protein MKW98_001903 [Papaver atlanticum]|uniref:Uncharacterized protein n=1 Tax=Papaver atlanticum TaxID=357466 RepID=A0AAD4T2C3_9MAGN|nr:hypothetical protein MKW98_001903 [Papaver atlanticum]
MILVEHYAKLSTIGLNLLITSAWRVWFDFISRSSSFFRRDFEYGEKEDIIDASGSRTLILRRQDGWMCNQLFVYLVCGLFASKFDDTTTAIPDDQQKLPPPLPPTHHHMNVKSFVRFESVTFRRTKEATVKQNPMRQKTGLVEAVLFEVNDRDRIGGSFVGSDALCCTPELAKHGNCKVGEVIIHRRENGEWPYPNILRRRRERS